MGILGKTMGAGKKDKEDLETRVCPHTALTPRWDLPQDLGNPELATFVCDSCGEVMSYDHARHILEPGERTPNLPIG